MFTRQYVYYFEIRTYLGNNSLILAIRRFLTKRGREKLIISVILERLKEKISSVFKR